MSRTTNLVRDASTRSLTSLQLEIRERLQVCHNEALKFENIQEHLLEQCLEWLDAWWDDLRVRRDSLQAIVARKDGQAPRLRRLFIDALQQIHFCEIMLGVREAVHQGGNPPHVGASHDRNNLQPFQSLWQTLQQLEASADPRPDQELRIVPTCASSYLSSQSPSQRPRYRESQSQSQSQSPSLAHILHADETPPASSPLMATLTSPSASERASPSSHGDYIYTYGTKQEQDSVESSSERPDRLHLRKDSHLASQPTHNRPDAMTLSMPFPPMRTNPFHASTILEERTALPWTQLFPQAIPPILPLPASPPNYASPYSLSPSRITSNTTRTPSSIIDPPNVWDYSHSYSVNDTEYSPPPGLKSPPSLRNGARSPPRSEAMTLMQPDFQQPPPKPWDPPLPRDA